MLAYDSPFGYFQSGSVGRRGGCSGRSHFGSALTSGVALRANRRRAAWPLLILSVAVQLARRLLTSSWVGSGAAQDRTVQSNLKAELPVGVALAPAPVNWNEALPLSVGRSESASTLALIVPAPIALPSSVVGASAGAASAWEGEDSSDVSSEMDFGIYASIVGAYHPKQKTPHLSDVVLDLFF